MSSRCSFFDFPSEFECLAKKENFQLEELFSLVNSCTRTANDVPHKPEKVGKAVRSIFISTQQIFFRIQPTLPPLEQIIILTFASAMLTRVPNLPPDVLNGLEPLVVRVSAAAMPLFEEQPVNEKTRIKLLNFLQPLTIELEKMDLTKAPLLQVLDLFMRCVKLLAHNLEGCDENSFIGMSQHLSFAAKKLGDLGGVGQRVLDCLRTQLSGIDPKGFLSVEYIQRLFSLIGGCLSGLGTASAFHLTAEADASLRGILDSLDRILLSLFQRGLAPEDKKNLLHVRKTALAGACLTYPLAIIERGGLSALPIDAPPGDILFWACLGLVRADPALASRELFVMNFCSIIAFMAQQGDRLSQNDFEKSAVLIPKTVEKWQLDPLSFKRIWLTIFTRIEEELRNPRVSFDGFQNLIELMGLAILMFKQRDRDIDSEIAGAFFKTANLFIDAFVRIPHPEGWQKDLLVKTQKVFVGSVIDVYLLQPSCIHFATIFDWFERIPADIAEGRGFIAAELVRALQEMLPNKTLPSYASAQLARTLSFIIRNLPRMSDSELYRCCDHFLTIQKAWLGYPGVTLELVRTWANELSWLLEQCRLAEKDCVEKCGTPRKRKADPLFQAWARFFENEVRLLTLNLSLFISGHTSLPKETSDAMVPLVDRACEMLSRTDKFMRLVEGSSFEASDQLLSFLRMGASGAVFDWLERTEPGKVSYNFIRKTEQSLISSERCTVVSDIQSRLFFLELIGAELERYCYKEGVRLKPHPELSTPTLSSSCQDALQLQMEESMVLGTLDAFCALNCIDYANDPIKRIRALFALRFYFRAYIEKTRKVYVRVYRGFKKLFPSQAIHREDVSEKVFGPRSLAPIEKGSLTPRRQWYEEFCSGRCPQGEDVLGFLDQAVAEYQHLFQDAMGFTSLVSSEFQSLWPYQEQGAKVVNKHTRAIAGYNRTAELSEKPVSIHILQCSRSSVEAISTFSFDPWIQRLLVGGERGLAAAIADLIAPGNTFFSGKLFRELGLLSDKNSPPPSPAVRLSPSEWLPDALKLPPKVEIRKPFHRLQKRRVGGSRSYSSSGHRSEAASSSQKEASSLKASPVESPDVLRPIYPQEVFAEEEVEPIVLPSRREEVESPAVLHSIQPQEVVVEEEDELIVLPPQREDKVELPKEVSPSVPWVRRVTVSDIDRLMRRYPRNIDWRVHRWKESFFQAPSWEQYYRHTYPFQLGALIKELGEWEEWASIMGTMNQHFVCIGRMECGGRVLFGEYSEGFTMGDHPLWYHHDLLCRSEPQLERRFLEEGSFFDKDSRQTPKATTPFQQALFKKFRQERSFFSSLEGVQPEECYGGRFLVQIGDLTLRVKDRMSGSTYTLALKIQKEEPK